MTIVSRQEDVTLENGAIRCQLGAAARASQKHMAEILQLASPPEIDPDTIEQCRKVSDFRPVLFEWYKYVGLITNQIACIRRDSPALAASEPVHYAVLVGLLNRCARLMLANVALSSTGRFGETTSIVDRCILESAIKVMWLCTNPSAERFDRLIADGLKTELEFEERIKGKIQRRSSPLTIESRMLRSIDNHIRESGLSREYISASKKTPDLASMIAGLGEDRLFYVIVQRIGSHHVHGTWPSLLFHYLKQVDAELVPRDHDCTTDTYQFVFVPVLVVRALQAFVALACAVEDLRTELDATLASVAEEIMALGREAAVVDFP